jgi:hypothetical protein
MTPPDDLMSGVIVVMIVMEEKHFPPTKTLISNAV